MAWRAAKDGEVIFTHHCSEQMKSRKIGIDEISHALTQGEISEPPEQDHYGDWKYRLQTDEVVLVFVFNDEASIEILTTWRNS